MDGKRSDFAGMAMPVQAGVMADSLGAIGGHAALSQDAAANVNAAPEGGSNVSR
jgi:hypothetical protein